MSYNPKHNYCTLSPDSLFGVKFNYACYLHDRQYRNEVVARKTRKQADLDFFHKIREIFKSNKKPLDFGLFQVRNPFLIKHLSNIIGFWVGMIYFRAVHRFAWLAWK